MSQSRYPREKSSLPCAVAVALASICQTVSAQTSVAGGSSSAGAIEEVVVYGVRQSIRSSLDQKKDATGFVDAISADDIGRFPDMNLSESLQRVPGVTLSRNDFGDGSAISVRGLPSNFTRYEINGMTAPVNDARGGSFQFEILASELFSNVAVKKTAGSSDVEGGLAALVQMSTPKALSYEGLQVTGSLTGQYAERADDWGPRAALFASNNWDDKFGIVASVAYSDTAYLTASNGGISARPLFAPATAELRASATAEQLSSVIPSTLNYEINNDERETLGATLGMQFRPSDSLELSVDGILGRIEGDRRFTRADAPPESQISSIENETIAGGIIQSATLATVQNRIATNDNDIDEDFLMLSASGTYQANDEWTVSSFVGYTERELENDASLLSFARGDLSTGSLLRFPVSYDINGQFIEFASPGLNLDDPTLAEEYFLNVFLIRPTVDRDEETSAKLDFSRALSADGASRVDFGFRYSQRETERQFTEVRVDDVPGADLRTLPTLASALLFEELDIDGMPASFPNRVLSADPDAILGLYFPAGFNIDAYRGPTIGELENERIFGLTPAGSLVINRQARTTANSFAGEEETLAAYVEATFEWDSVLFNVGVRYIDTDQTSSGYQIANSISTPISFSNNYSELLPNMSLRYQLSPELSFRGAYSKTLTRPTLSDLRVSESFGGIDESGGSGSRGNPALDPFTSDNLDLGIEWYFGDEALLAATFFYKDIDGLIVGTSVTEEREFLSQVTGELVTGPIVFSQPSNGDPAEVTGLEVILQSRFSFLEGFWSDFGGIFNYTYTDSDAAFEEGEDSSEVASLPGISENSFNAILYYDNGMIDARLSYAYRDRFVLTTAGSFGVPVFHNDYGQLDFSANIDITDKLTLQFQALNLTEERREFESVLGLPHDTAQLDRRFFVGARYDF